MDNGANLVAEPDGETINRAYEERIRELTDHLGRRTIHTLESVDQDTAHFYGELAKTYCMGTVFPKIQSQRFQNALVSYCGAGNIVHWLARQGVITLGIEIDQRFLDVARKKSVDGANYNLEADQSLPLGRFRPDLVISPFSLHRMRDPKKILEQVLGATTGTIYVTDFVRDISPEDLLYLQLTEDFKGTPIPIDDQLELRTFRENLIHPLVFPQHYLSDVIQASLSKGELRELCRELGIQPEAKVNSIKGPCNTTIHYVTLTINKK